MTGQDNLLPVLRPNLFAKVASLTVMLVGYAALFGWTFDISVLKSVIPGFATMKANTALVFVLAGLSLWLSQTPEPRPSRNRVIAKVSALLVTLIALLTLAEYLMSYDFGIDEILAMDPATQLALHPGRMSLATAINFLVLGAALLLLDVEIGHGNFPSQWLSLFAGFVSLLALIGYAYDVEALYGNPPFASVALHTATAFFLLSLGILCARGKRGWLSIYADLRFGLVPQVIALVVVAVVLVGGLISAVMVRQSQRALREQIVANNLADADLVAEFAWRYMQGAQSSFEFLATSSSVVQAVTSEDFTQATRNLQEFRRINTWVNSCNVYDTNGINRATGSVSAVTNVGRSSGDREWFQQVMSTGKSYLGLPVITRGAKRPVIPYAVPVHDSKGQVRGVLAGGISLEVLADTITGFQSGQIARTSLIDRRRGGIILADLDHKRILRPAAEKNQAERLMLNGERGAMETTNNTGEIDLASFAPVPNLPWGVMILLPRQAAFATIADSVRRTLSLIGILLLFGALGAGLLARRVTRPLSQLREAAKSVAAGELTKRLNFTRQDELGDLGRTFDHMSAVLSERTAQLEHVNDTLQEQNREVQQASRLKSEFLANMSHELRTPLNAIIGFAQLMHDGKVGSISANHKEYLGDILGSARHLLQLINDILDLAKVEAGKMEFSPEPVSLTKIIGEVRQVLQALSASKRLAIEVEVSPAVERLIIDPAKLKQVLYNYLSNAIKFTPEAGRITVRALAEGDDSFRLEVEDTGIGIAEQEISKLFVEFQQLEAGTTKKHQGTGLGLALTKRVVQAQGGRVGVKSTLDEGSVFCAVLPRVTRINSEALTGQG